MVSKKKAIIYTKICLPCVYKDGWALVQSWAAVNDVALQVRRTTYNPLFHKLATIAYGSDKYLAFMKIGKKNTRIKEMINLIEDNSNDLHNLLSAKKHPRKNRVQMENKKTSEKNKGEA